VPLGDRLGDLTDHPVRRIVSDIFEFDNLTAMIVVANHAAESLGRDDIRVLLVTPTDCEPVPQLSKEQAADRILGWLRARLQELA